MAPSGRDRTAENRRKGKQKKCDCEQASVKGAYSHFLVFGDLYRFAS
jgi:hypothetical protein